MMNHLFDVALVGLALLSVAVIFAGSVAFAIVACFVPKYAPKTQNFTYVTTAIAGLVLSVASGVLGAPATVQVQTPVAAHGSEPTEAVVDHQLNAQIAEPQVAAFKQLYAWTYVVTGLVCLLVFVLPTPATHDLVKNVALTTLGFLITLVGPVANKPPDLGTTRGAQAIIRSVR
jgi:hypothetical protein